MIIRLILIIVVFFVLFSLLQFVLSIHPPRISDPTTPEDYGMVYEQVSFTTADNLILSGWWIPSPKATGTVIVGHGYPFDKANIFPVARFLYPDYNLLFYDHRYFGESEGKITTGGINEVQDVRAAVEFAKKKSPQKPIALYGFSLSAAAMLMAKPEVEALIADSPYADLEGMLSRLYFYFGPLKWPLVKMTGLFGRIFLAVDLGDVSPAQAVKDLSLPIFLIHGERDSQIPVENAYALKESNPGIELWIVPGAEHGQAYALFPEEYERRVKRFLKKNLD